MTNPIGPLTAADEGLCHQIVDTFAVVGTSDLSWTEKVCAMAARPRTAACSSASVSVSTTTAT